MGGAKTIISLDYERAQRMVVDNCMLRTKVSQFKGTRRVHGTLRESIGSEYLAGIENHLVFGPLQGS